MRWDCHQHRDELRVSDSNTVYHDERGQLCYGYRHLNTFLFFPIQFKDKAAAYKWIESGCIAQLQEGLGCLAVGFELATLKIRSGWSEWVVPVQRRTRRA